MTKARDISKLSAVEADATADQTNAEVKAAVEAASDSNTFTDADHSKLNAIEASADVTDTANVTSSGALMDSELTNLAAVKAINQSLVTTADAAFASLDISGNIDVDGVTNLDVVDIDGRVNMSKQLTLSAADGAEDNNWVAFVKNLEATAGRSWGMVIDAGSNSSDEALRVNNYAGTNLFKVRGDGNVGIGTSSITSFSNIPNLTVGGSSGGMLTNQVNGTDGMRLYSNSSGTVLNETRNLFLAFSTNNTERFRIAADGSLSTPTLGTASAPATSGTTQTGSLRVSQTGGNGVLDMGFYTSSTGTAWIQSTNKADLSTNYGLTLQPNGGNVGIGTNSPSTMLHIENSSGNASAQLTSGTSGTSYINMGDTGNADAGQISYINNGDAMAFTAGSAERMRIHSNGVVSVPNGIELGSGLDGTAANTLDDYEEGTWTPSLTASGGASSQGYASRVGSYTKIGNKVTANWRILLNAKGSLTGTTRISGLPFAGNASPIYNVASTMVGLIYLADDENFKAMQYAANSFLYLMIEKDDTALSQISGNGNFDNDSEISGSVTYFTNS